MGRLYLVWYWGHAIARAPKEYLEGSGTLESRGPESWELVDCDMMRVNWVLDEGLEDGLRHDPRGNGGSKA